MKGTIKPSDEITEFFETARRFHTKTITALIRETGRKRGTRGRVAFIAGKRLGSAPARNKAKRRMREAAHILNAPWQGHDIVFIAKQDVLAKSFTDVVTDMGQIVKSLQEKEI